MIRYTCQHCNEKLESPDALAGMLDQCSGCGRTVAVPNQTEGHTEQDIVPRYKKGICPFCGSKNLQRVMDSQEFSIDGDRRCTDCGALWALPLPEWAAVIKLILIGLVGVFLLVVLLYELPFDGANVEFVCLAGIVFVSVPVWHAANRIRTGKSGEFKVLKRPKKKTP